MSSTGHLKPHWFHILLALAEGPLHGTAVMEEVLERTEGELRLWPGMLYGSLKELSEDDLIQEVEAPEGAPSEGGRRRFYALTRAGERVLAAEVRRLDGFVRVARNRGVAPEPGGA